MRIFKPRTAGKCIVWLEGITGRTVIDDQGLVQVSSQTRKIFDVNTLELETIFSIKTILYASLGV